MTSFFNRLRALFSPNAPVADMTNEETVRAFHEAVHQGNVEQVRTLLATRPALATSEDEYRFQPIHLMDMYFEPEIFHLLLHQGADINARNDEGVALLHILTDPDAVALLVKHGADLETRDARGWTPLLMQAGEQQNGSDVVAALLACGADANAVGNRGETALAMVRETEDETLTALLLSHSARP